MYKTLTTLTVLLFFATGLDASVIYNTLDKPKTGEFWSINFPIFQSFNVTQSSVIDEIIVGIPMKSTPGRKLTVSLYDGSRDLLTSYSTPSSYYYNVDHYYKFDSNYPLTTGNYYFSVEMSNGPTGWIGTTGGMLGRIDSHCVPEPSTYIMGAIIVVVLFATSWRIL